MGSAATQEYFCCGSGQESQKLFENAIKEIKEMDNAGYGGNSNHGILKKRKVSFTPNINLEMPRTAESRYEGFGKSTN